MMACFYWLEVFSPVWAVLLSLIITSLSELEARVDSDPFVAENVVSAEILEIEPKKADERLSFLLS
jgi:hypothetical protein